MDYFIDSKTDPDGLFTAEKSGIIRLVKPLDREVTSSHRLIIIATDQGKPVRSSTASLVVCKTCLFVVFKRTVCKYYFVTCK